MSNLKIPSTPGLAGELFLGSGLAALPRYVEIECLSPDFDPDWRSHGHIDRAAEFLAAWCTSQAVPNTTVEIIASRTRRR